MILQRIKYVGRHGRSCPKNILLKRIHILERKKLRFTQFQTIYTVPDRHNKSPRYTKRNILNIVNTTD